MYKWRCKWDKEMAKNSRPQSPNLAQNLLSEVLSTCEKLPNTLYIISGEYIRHQVLQLLSYTLLGSFNVIFLYILALNTWSHQINIIGRTNALGPHQYLARNAATDRLYTTTWAWLPLLGLWYIDWNEWAWRTMVPNAGTSQHNSHKWDLDPYSLLDAGSTECAHSMIASTSSYITLTDTHIYSAGGPTGEAHEIDPNTGGIGNKIEQLLYVDEDRLAAEDKTNKALVSPRSDRPIYCEKPT